MWSREWSCNHIIMVRMKRFFRFQETDLIDIENSFQNSKNQLFDWVFFKCFSPIFSRLKLPNGLYQDSLLQGQIFKPFLRLCLGLNGWKIGKMRRILYMVSFCKWEHFLTQDFLFERSHVRTVRKQKIDLWKIRWIVLSEWEKREKYCIFNSRMVTRQSSKIMPFRAIPIQVTYYYHFVLIQVNPLFTVHYKNQAFSILQISKFLWMCLGPSKVSYFLRTIKAWAICSSTLTKSYTNGLFKIIMMFLG